MWLEDWVRCVLAPKWETLWHPDSPGMRVRVKRTRIGRMLKPTCFATLGESLKYGKPVERHAKHQGDDMRDRVLMIVEHALGVAEEEFLQAKTLFWHKTEEESAQQAGKSTMTYGDILRKYEQDCTDMKQCIEWVKRQGD